eukprot:366017-Chlamydomonas_euryale.AAC.1
MHRSHHGRSDMRERLAVTAAVFGVAAWMDAGRYEAVAGAAMEMGVTFVPPHHESGLGGVDADEWGTQW